MKINEDARKLDPNLGKLGRDQVSGFEGIITVKGIHLFGCETYCLSPKVKDGKLEDSHSFDAGRIEIIGEGIDAEKVQAKHPGAEKMNLEERIA